MLTLGSARIDIERVARAVAAQSRNLDFDDVFQEAMIRLLANPPLSLVGAYRIATSARNDLWRKERRHRGQADIAGRELAEEGGEGPRPAEGIYERLHELAPDEVDYLVAYHKDRRPKPGKDSKRASDYRKRIREILAILRDWGPD